MPHETVQYPRTNGNSGTEVSVYWGKEQGYVQLAMTRHVWIPNGPGDPGQVRESDPVTESGPLPDAARHADHDSCADCHDQPQHEVKSWGGDIKAVLQPPPTEEVEIPATVWSDELTRDQINKLIRVLRRARDHAMGADA